jgi:pimeloyl-ACP methyl ester carboxylesterase
MRKALIVLAALLASPAVEAQRGGTPDAIVPFKIQVSNADLADLKQRLSRARYADSFDDADWNYGTNAAYLKELIAYWRDKYDWRAQERDLNKFDQFKTTIDGVEIYFVHQKAVPASARTVLLLNGWPSSIVEYQKVIGPLTNPAAFGGRAEDAVNVVIPSMPGFGFSGKPRVKGYDFDRIAGMWVQLMARLGYARYFVHGTDFGGLVGPRVALLDPSHVAGLHLAGCGGAPAAPAPAAGAAAAAPAPQAAAVGRNALVNAAHNVGYQEIQSTKPDTLGHALSDSPVGLASWIVEKWYDWADHDGDVEKTFTRDELLTNVMIYWVTNSTASSMRIYYEGRHAGGGFRNNPFPPFDGRVAVPTGCGAFPRQYDRRTVPVNTNTAAARQAAESRYNVVHFTTMERGGHFPALEAPDDLAAELRAFFRAFRSRPT